jgi:hypothetical protein
MGKVQCMLVLQHILTALCSNWLTYSQICLLWTVTLIIYSASKSQRLPLLFCPCFRTAFFSVIQINKTNSVALSPQANYTEWSNTTCRRILVPNFVNRGVSHGQRSGTLTAVNLSFLDRSRCFFFQVAPHLSSQGLIGPRSRPTATQKNLVAPGIEPGTSGSSNLSNVSNKRRKILVKRWSDVGFITVTHRITKSWKVKVRLLLYYTCSSVGYVKYIVMILRFCIFESLHSMELLHFTIYSSLLSGDKSYKKELA